MVNRTDNNTYNRSIATASRGKWVMAQSDPNNLNPIARAKIEALVGPGNVIVLPDSEFIKYIEQGDPLTSLQSETSTPLGYLNSDGGSSVEIPTDVKLPPPTNLKVIGTPKPTTSGGVTTLSINVQFEKIVGNNVKYTTTVIKPTYPLPLQVLNYNVTVSYPQVRVDFDTVNDATSYVLTITNTSTKAFESIPVVPATLSAATAYGIFRNVPHGTYKITITPYSPDYVSGQPNTLSEVYTV
jgi:hypothetical protein